MIHELTPATAKLAYVQDARRRDPTVRVIILTVMGTKSLFVVIGQEIEVVGEDLDGAHFIMRDFWKMPFTELGEAEVMKIKLHGCNIKEAATEQACRLAFSRLLMERPGLVVLRPAHWR